MRSSPMTAGIALAAAIAWIIGFVATHTAVVIVAIVVTAGALVLPLLLARPLVKRTATPLMRGARPEPTKSQETGAYAAPGPSQ